MRQTFFGYYPPKDEDFQILWNDALIVLDTNVLLNLYRSPTTAREEFFGVLTLFRERLWIPYQVALEFQRRRLSVIASERKITEDSLRKSRDSIEEILQSVDALQLDKRALEIDSTSVIKSLNEAKEKLVAAVSSAHNAQLDISASDPIRDQLDNLLQGNIGAGPKNQQELDDLCSGGDMRYQEKIPPGFSDIDKDKNPNEATFIHEHIKYQRKFGDLILWKQIINHVKADEIKNLILVTADKKEDWWWREQGKTVGPHPELVYEMRRNTPIKSFWLYTPSQFLEHAVRFSIATVSKESVEEIENVSLLEDSENFKPTFADNIKDYGFNQIPSLESERKSNISIVADWLEAQGCGKVHVQKSFPRLVTTKEGEVVGYEIIACKISDLSVIPEYVSIVDLNARTMVQAGWIKQISVFVLLEDHSAKEQVKSYAHALISLMSMPTNLKNVGSVIFGKSINERFHVIKKWKP